MVKLTAPCYSLQARGWLGRWQYGQRGFVSAPYPIGLFPRYLIHSFYYSPKGWCYQLRRTWHGIVWAAMRPPISIQPNTAIQYAYKQIFAEAVHVWQGMNEATKSVYKAWSYPVHASGYNRWLRWFLKERLRYEVVANYILNEDGTYLLTEVPEKLIQE